MTSRSNPSSNATNPQAGLPVWGFRVRNGGFASLKLGASGWLALLSPGVVIGLLIARLSDSSFLLWGVIGGVTIWVIAVAVERFFAGNRPGKLSVEPSLTDTELDAVSEAARYAGIKFEHVVDDASDDGSVLASKTKFLTRLNNIVHIVRGG